jgi:hypothetical protein
MIHMKAVHLSKVFIAYTQSWYWTKVQIQLYSLYIWRIWLDVFRISNIAILEKAPDKISFCSKNVLLTPVKHRFKTIGHCSTNIRPITNNSGRSIGVRFRILLFYHCNTSRRILQRLLCYQVVPGHLYLMCTLFIRNSRIDYTARTYCSYCNGTVILRYVSV